MIPYFKDIRATIEIDLSQSSDDIWNKLDKDARWGINKAEKEGLSVEQSNKKEDLERFYNIYEKTIIYGGIAPDSIKKLKKEEYVLFVAKKDEEIIAGAIIEIINKEKYQLEYNASLHNFLKYQPNNLLYWELIKWGKKEGFKIFDLGGYQIKAHGHLAGVNKFKERWGGEMKTYPIRSYNPIYIFGRKIIRNFPIVKITKDKLKLKKYLLTKKYSRSIKKFGFWGFLKKLFNKVIYDKKKIIIYSNDLDKNLLIEPKINAKMRLVGMKELIPLLKENGLIDQETIEERLDDGKKCFAYFMGSNLVHYSWLAFKEIEISEVKQKINLNDNEACIFDCWTSEKFRGKNLYPSMLTHIKKYLKENGYKKCYIYVESNNKPSIKGIEKAGFMETKKIDYLNILSFKKNKVLGL